MKGFLPIETVTLPMDCIHEAYRHMRDRGAEHLEGVALFAGRVEGCRFEVQQTLIPRQISLSIEEGLLYAVDAEELHRLNVYLFSKGLRLIAQIHSHPQRAYHSPTDDAFPIVATQGGLSIVVPNFAAGEPSLDAWAVYRLSACNVWEELSGEEKTKLVHFIS